MPKRIKKLSDRSPTHLIAAALALHLILTVSIYAGGRLKIARIINEDGVVDTLAHDSLIYLPQVQSLSDTLTRQGIAAWLAAPFSLHLKLYSLTFALLQSWLGANILSAEPINSLCYIAILCLTCKLGEEVFDRRVGLCAAAAVAVWPSFLLHTTQLLKDPLFIVALLILLLINACWLTRAHSLVEGLGTGLAGGAAACVISRTRSDSWMAVVLALASVGLGLLVIRQLRERRVLAGNVVSAVLVLSISSAMLLSAKETYQAAPATVEPSSAGNDSIGIAPTNSIETNAGRSPGAPDRPAISSLRARADSGAMRLSQLRYEFIRQNGDAGSNMDGEVEFKNVADVVRYLPRAAEIGFFAPFPDQWIASGRRVGLAGRLMSGLEMTAMYAVELLALVGLWRARSSLPAWLLFSASVVGIMALALAVINVGALYRMRYGFLILLCILGAHGLMQIRLRKGERTAFAG
jgi:hypothetical protein